MRTLFSLLFLLFPFVCGAKFTTELKRISKLDEQLKTGNYSRHIAAKNQLRASITNQPFTDYYDNYYLGTVAIGTVDFRRQDQQFYMIMDTGSAYVWVMSSSCTGNGCNSCTNDYTRQKFYLSQSSTYVNTGKSFTYFYDDSINVGGYLAKDRFVFGALTSNQTFGLATWVDPNFCYEPADGVFGMAFPIIGDNLNHVVPPLQNVLSQLNNPVFTIFMGRQNDTSQGRITYGDLDYYNCGSEVIYKPLSRAAYWQFTLDSVSFGSNTYNVAHRMEAISDSGSSWIITPRQFFIQIIATLNAQFAINDQTYWVPCTSVNSLPTLYITVNGRNLDVPPQEYTLNYNKGDNRCWLTFDYMDSNGFSEPSWILGDTFIRSWCQTYDIGQTRIGFSVAKNRPRMSSGQLSLFSLFAVTLLKVVL